MMTMAQLAEKQVEESERFGPNVRDNLMDARVAFAKALMEQPNMPGKKAEAVRDLFFRQM